MKKLTIDMKKLLPLLCCAVLAPRIIYAQSPNSIQASFEKYTNTVFQEKVYAHTDRTFYMTGEILWFKLYVADAGQNKLSDLSKVAHVDVLDANNDPVMQAKIALKNGTGSGSLYIPVTLGNGNYKLRAYTNWMKNFSPDLYFEKQLTIVNPLVTPDAPVKLAKGEPDIQFFPEGGSLVNGLNSTVGFKATGPDGKGINVTGVIINQRSDTVAHFSTAGFGMGRFAFTPAANNTYKAVVRAGADNVVIKQLPAANSAGYVMHLTDDGSKQLQVKISGTNSGETYLLAHNGATVTVAQAIRPDASGVVMIDKDKLGDGISHITLFNSARQAVAERLYFKRPAVMDITADMQLQRGTRKKMNIYIAAKSSDGKPQAADLSIAVYHLDSLNKTPGTDIASYFWLASELKGNIESPEYYFNNVSPATNQALDNLLLTQGWSRFKWDDVLSGAKPSFSFLPEYNGHLVSGKITTRDGAPVNYKTVYLGVISKKPQLAGATATGGQLLFNTRELYGSNEIVLQTNTQVDTTGYRITINSPFSEQYSSAKLNPFYLNKAFSRQLDENGISMQVQNLYKPERLRQFNTAGIDSTGFYANLYKPYLLDKYTRFTTMEEVLREYVSEVNVVKTGPHFRIKVINPAAPDEFLEGDPLVLLDGVPIFNMDKVIAIDPMKIRRLETVNRQYYEGPINASGILSYTSYKTDLGGQELDPRSVVLDYEGMQLKREFYSPVYDTDDQQKSRIPDMRTLLFWSPGVNTGADGKAQASFYTSDRTGRYIGVIQGIAGNGQAGAKYFVFDVNK